MLWIAFGAGVFVGTIAAIVAVALCQMASRHAKPSGCSCRPDDDRHDPIQMPLLVRNTR